MMYDYYYAPLHRVQSSVTALMFAVNSANKLKEYKLCEETIIDKNASIHTLQVNNCQNKMKSAYLGTRVELIRKFN